MMKYVCKYCGQDLGRIENNNMLNIDLGLTSLTPEESQSIITYGLNGDVTVKVVCEFCEEALKKNPELILISNPLQ